MPPSTNSQDVMATTAQKVAAGLRLFNNEQDKAIKLQKEKNSNDEKQKKQTDTNLKVTEYVLGRVPIFGDSLQRLANISLTSGSKISALGGTAAFFFDLLVALGKAAVKTYLALSAAATPGGTKIFDEALGILAATIGSTLIPVFPLLAAASLTLANIFSFFVPSVADSTTAIRLLKKYLQEFESAMHSETWSELWDMIRDGFREVITDIAIGLKRVIEALVPFANHLGMRSDEAIEARARQLFGADPNSAQLKSPPHKTMDVGAAFDNNMQDVISQLKITLAQSNGMKAQFMGLGDVWKNMQMQSFESPFQRQMRELMMRTVTALEKSAAKPTPFASGVY